VISTAASPFILDALGDGDAWLEVGLELKVGPAVDAFGGAEHAASNTNADTAISRFIALIQPHIEVPRG
jgi:hypothetical protein